MLATLDFPGPMLPADRPRYLMGVGKPDDIVEVVCRGIDMFDCVPPTRSGRTGQAFTRYGPINIRNARFAEDKGPLDPDRGCSDCTGWCRAYLHHLVKSGVILGAMMMPQQNICFYQHLIAELRDEKAEGRVGVVGWVASEVEKKGGG